MQFDFYSYHAQMQTYLDAQNSRICCLEKELAALRGELEELKKKPAVNVERIEYKFDQLKVETLEGTLNIGLNPGDLGDIDELSVPGAAQALQPYLLPNREEFIEEICRSVAGEMGELINDTKKQLGRPLDSGYQEIIQADIERQLPERAALYLDQTAQPDRVPHLREEVKEKISEKIKNDIIQAVRSFILQTAGPPGGNPT